MQTLSVALKFAEKGGYKVDVNQELLALGACHLVASFSQAMDVCGSFSRTAVNSANGAKSQVSSLVSALVVIAALSFATPLFAYIPQPTLAAIVVHAVIKMFELESLMKLQRTKKRDYQVAVITMGLTVLTTSQIGLAAGIAISLFLILDRAAHPTSVTLGCLDVPPVRQDLGNSDPSRRVHAEHGTFRNVARYPQAKQYRGIIVQRFDAELWFANAEYFKAVVQDAIEKRRVSGRKATTRTPLVGNARHVSGYGSLENTAPNREIMRRRSRNNVEIEGAGLLETVARRPSNPSSLREEEIEDEDIIRVLVLDMSSINGEKDVFTLLATVPK
ncbi:hypothetical protein HDU93_004461, partial [Gonapodya sp. JEL0774]